jgi:hypothetical protein
LSAARVAFRESVFSDVVPTRRPREQLAQISLDYFVGAGEHCMWDIQAESAGRLKVYNKIELRRRLHWQIGHPFALTINRSSSTIEIDSSTP